MLFSSAPFFAFFAVYFLIHLATPLRWRTPLVIAGSTIFYAWWRVDYVWLPFALTLTAYFGVRWMERAADPRGRRLRAVSAIAVLSLPLIIFKYFDFFYRTLLPGRAPIVDLPLPLGVSFVTFTLIAYVVDVMHARFSPVHRAQTLLGYVLFFPHLIAGPILRPSELIPQIERPRWAARTWYAPAAALFTLGLIKKVVFADQLGAAVDPVFAPGANPGALAALLGMYGFAAQIYCDFSGYTDMAIGLAMMLGVKLPTNFRRPYGAASLGEFWRRWHITLSFWLRDYLYKPLGGSRHGLAADVRNVMITMTLGGLWHGANWTFVVWGVLHGAAIAVEHVWRAAFGKRTPRLPRVLRALVTFHVVLVAWVFFRAPSVAQALSVLAMPFGSTPISFAAFASANAFPLALVAVFFATHRFDDHRRVRIAARRAWAPALWAVLVLLWLLAIAIGQGSSAKFIYFDF